MKQHLEILHMQFLTSPYSAFAFQVAIIIPEGSCFKVANAYWNFFLFRNYKTLEGILQHNVRQVLLVMTVSHNLLF